MRSRMTRQQIAHNACAFRLWREGSAVAWDCSATDLHRATGVSEKTIRVIAAERGWDLRDDRGATSGNTSRVPVDVLMRASDASNNYVMGRE